MTDPLQEMLAAEHAAVWVYGVLGGQTSQSGQPQLFAAVDAGYTAHRDRRDQLVRRLRDRGVEPVAAKAGYALPRALSDGLRSPGGIARVGLRTERRCAATYADVVARVIASDRTFAVAALTDAALRELDFGGRPESLPGIR